MSPNRWIKSLGGPLILVPESSIGHWQGEHGPSGEEDWPEEETDYWKASDIADWVGLIKVDDHDALVLSGEPAPTTYLPAARTFVQRLALPANPDLLLSSVHQLMPSIKWADKVEWTVTEPAILFDAVLPGTEVGPEVSLRVDLDPGTYLVKVAYHEAETDEDPWVTLIQLVPRGSG
jgi:hypothetical protein